MAEGRFASESVYNSITYPLCFNISQNLIVLSMYFETFLKSRLYPADCMVSNKTENFD